MIGCSLKAVWILVPKSSNIVRTNLRRGHYCNNHKKYQIKYNNSWKEFKKMWDYETNKNNRR